MGVSLNGGAPKSSILMGFSMINHPLFFLETPIYEMDDGMISYPGAPCRRNCWWKKSCTS